MTATRFISIRYTLVGICNRRAYVWTCGPCNTRGYHRFDRFSDRSRPAPHPWLRCLAAVDLHICNRHPERMTAAPQHPGDEK